MSAGIYCLEWPVESQTLLGNRKGNIYTCVSVESFAAAYVHVYAAEMKGKSGCESHIYSSFLISLNSRRAHKLFESLRYYH